MAEDHGFSSIFSQENWPTDIAYWLLNGTVKVPIGCEVCGSALRYRAGSRNAENWEERYYCPHCGWPEEAVNDTVQVPIVFLEYDDME